MNEDHIAALDKIASYLATRDHSEMELKTKLSRRFDQEICQQALAEAKNRGWLKDPHELARQVASQLHARSKGGIYINNYLRSKGLPPVDLLEEDELEKCQHWYRVKFANVNISDEQIKGKIVRHLRNRGFNDGIIMKVIYENQ